MTGLIRPGRRCIVVMTVAMTSFFARLIKHSKVRDDNPQHSRRQASNAIKWPSNHISRPAPRNQNRIPGSARASARLARAEGGLSEWEFFHGRAGHTRDIKSLGETGLRSQSASLRTSMEENSAGWEILAGHGRSRRTIVFGQSTCAQAIARSCAEGEGDVDH